MGFSWVSVRKQWECVYVFMAGKSVHACTFREAEGLEKAKFYLNCLNVWRKIEEKQQCLHSVWCVILHQSFRLRHSKRFALLRVGQATRGRRNIILNHTIQGLVCEHAWLALWVRESPWKNTFLQAKLKWEHFSIISLVELFSWEN